MVTRFFFSVENGRPGITYTFNIVNSIKPSSQYSLGMQVTQIPFWLNCISACEVLYESPGRAVLEAPRG